MLIFVIPIIIGCMAIYLAHVSNKLISGRHGTKFERWCSRYNDAWSFATVVSIIILVISLGLLISNHADCASFPSEYQSIKTTMSTADTHIEIERAAIIQKVMDINRELAVAKYWDDSIWLGWFWPDKMANLEYIQ